MVSVPWRSVACWQTVLRIAALLPCFRGWLSSGAARLMRKRVGLLSSWRIFSACSSSLGWTGFLSIRRADRV